MKCILFVGIIATIFVSGRALQCYHSVEIDKSSIIGTKVLTCDQKSVACLKSTTKLKNGTVFVARSCLPGKTVYERSVDQLPYDSTPTAEVLEYTCVHFCDTDSCNGSQSIIAVFSIILASLCTSIFSSY